jgi:hypothetical protein
MVHVYSNTRPSLQATSRQRVADIFAGQQGMHAGNQPASPANPASPATIAKVLAWLAMPLAYPLPSDNCIPTPPRDGMPLPLRHGYREHLTSSPLPPILILGSIPIPCLISPGADL